VNGTARRLASAARIVAATAVLAAAILLGLAAGTVLLMLLLGSVS
jgi:hypothetical protein